MSSNKRWFLPFLMILTLLLAACGGAAAEPTPAPNPTAAETGGDDGAEAAEPTAVAEEPEAEPTEAPAEVEPTEEPEAEPTEEATDDSGSNTPAGESTSIEDAEGIDSYRFTGTITASGEAFEADEEMAMFSGGITIEGAFVKDPRASDVAMEIPGLGELGFREVDGTFYANFGGMWTEASADDGLNIDDLAPVSADDLSDDLDRMENAGEEEVNGRDTTHYIADKDLLQEIAESEGDASFDFANADEAQLDVWLDQEYGFVVKMELAAEGAGLNDQAPDAEGRVEFNIDYYDFNASDIEIEVPEVTDMGDTGTDSGDTGTDSGDTGTDESMDATDIPGLLGFDMELPADATSDVSFGTASITIPLPQDEAQAIIVEAFEANGYELNPDLSSPELGILWYENGEKEWYVTLTETDGVTEVFIF